MQQPSATRAAYTETREFLTGVRPDFVPLSALARIEGRTEELGDSFLWASRAGLVRELAEESVDIASWAALIAVRIERDGGDVQRARALLTAIAQRADEADRLIDELRRLLLGGSA